MTAEFDNMFKEKKMNKFSLFLNLFLGLNFLFAAFGCQPDKNSPEAILENLK